MYTLREVTERWQKTENDILRMAIEGEVVLSAWWSGVFLLETSRDRWVKPCNGLFEIKRELIGGLLACGESLEISSFEDGAESIYFALEEPNRLVSFELTREKIVIDFAHLADAEANNPELVAGVADNLQKDLPLLEGMKDETPDTISTTWQEIKSKSGMTRNTFQEWAGKVGVPWKNEEGEVQITLEDILRVKSFRDKTKKRTKKEIIF
jgi:hypothetical protein